MDEEKCCKTCFFSSIGYFCRHRLYCGEDISEEVDPSDCCEKWKPKEEKTPE